MGLENEKEKKYDFALKNKNERGIYVENKLGFIFEMPPHIIMGYMGKDRNWENKFDKIPKMIDAYTAYFLTSRDVESSRKTEYSFFVDRRDQMRRKTNRTLFVESKPYDGKIKEDIGNVLNPCDTYSKKDSTYGAITDFGFESGVSQVVKYAISKGGMSKGDYKKILAMSTDILLESKDEELKSMIEQIVFNCRMHVSNDTDMLILKELIRGSTLREIAEKTGVSKSSVDRRIGKLLEWVGQE